MRRLVLSLGTATSSSQVPADTARGEDNSTPVAEPDPPSTSRETERHA